MPDRAATAPAPRQGGGMTRLLVDFAGELRRAGLTAGTGDVLTFAAATAELDPTDLLDLYWAGRTTLVTRRDDIACYDDVFRRFFLGGAAPAAGPLRLKAQAPPQVQAMLALPDPDKAGDEGEEQEATLGWMASDVEALKHKAFTSCTAEELAAVSEAARQHRYHDRGRP